ncbi:MAG: sigma-70 family RNA polymerase sigma factor [Bryobacteraceae bacterium]
MTAQVPESRATRPHGAEPALVGPQAMPGEQTSDPEQERADTFHIPDWAQLVARIHDGDPAAMEELYGIFGKGIRYFLLRNLGADELDDKVHDCFVIVAQAIQNGELRDPARLMGFVRTVVKRQIAATIEAAVTRRRTQVDYQETLFTLTDWKDDPERTLLARQRAEIARRVMNGISRRDREILRRFYVEEQSQEKICEEMGLSYNQFRLLKSRAKARFGELGKRVASGLGLTFKKTL